MSKMVTRRDLFLGTLAAGFLFTPVAMAFDEIEDGFVGGDFGDNNRLDEAKFPELKKFKRRKSAGRKIVSINSDSLRSYLADIDDEIYILLKYSPEKIIAAKRRIKEARKYIEHKYWDYYKRGLFYGDDLGFHKVTKKQAKHDFSTANDVLDELWRDVKYAEKHPGKKPKKKFTKPVG